MHSSSVFPRKSAIPYSSIGKLWETYKVDYKNNSYLAKHSFDNLVMTLIFLYSVGSVLEKNG
ncbi:MAG: hypothetical protein L3J52_00470, partial [Proteobacteria bacterium]|nr:hypothetical protein [Pseudomonadota bacterium]